MLVRLPVQVRAWMACVKFYGHACSLTSTGWSMDGMYEVSLPRLFAFSAGWGMLFFAYHYTLQHGRHVRSFAAMLAHLPVQVGTRMACVKLAAMLVPLLVRVGARTAR